ncbi:unnamed protein product [Bursaphelenchus okinawaensis]|uniref:Apple domain-containing protein n=1 Tax=Bursaphelenchus okinawaensis TaxID=465554 RepID=A0A811LKG2_9BILA|nr:unnamed protein product [Bursaphelenchus okinawaensis]CAG9127493.1 unnamed protein product [Bursaphelenchus okinawaensis]
MARLKAISLFISIILVIPLTKACFPAFTTPQYYAPPPTQYYYYQQQPQVPYAASRTRLSPNNHQFSEQKDDSPVTSGGNDCLQKFENQKLICAEPIERRTETSEDECQQLCDTVQCKSFQFDSATSGCDVFHVDNQNSQPRNPFNDREQGFRHKRYNEITKTTVGHVKRIFKRAATNFDDIFRDSLRTLPNGESVTSYCSPSLVSSPGYTYTLVDEDCKLSIKEGLIHGAHDEFVGAIESFNSENGALKTPSHRNPGPVQVVIPETPDCADGNKARVQLIEGIKLIDAVAVTTVQLDNPEMCLQVCRMNAHLDGTRFSRGCKSAVFDRSNGKCSIYGEVISPNGDLNYHPDPNSVYFEKYCMNASELPISCDDVIHRIPQHTLDKRAIGTGTVVTTATQIDCIRQCITAKRRHNFECRAISYFFDWPSENCYLSRFTRIQRPDVYVPERKELVDYLEMPHCFGNTIGNSK